MSDSEMIVGKIEQLTTNAPELGVSETASCSTAFSDREMELMRRAFSAGMERATLRECFKFLGWFDREKDLLAKIGR